ncbi:MAG TPA: exodeoxyribonuclease VII small subunit [Nitrospirales bacterium]|nr:exodeoxyribonuclease VII small subunit [Nitrospirales bacterium]
MPTVKFEEALARLEAIVAELERGELPLEDSMRIFEEGIKLSKVCLKMLEEAERKVEVLVKDKDGRKRTRTFDLEEFSETGQANRDVED